MRRRADTAGKIVYTHLHPGLQRMTKAYTATGWIHYDRMTGFRELGRRIEAGYAQRNLRPNSRAPAALRSVKTTSHTQHCKRESPDPCRGELSSNKPK